jgi:NNP family nitrate/nitrite transporter-like MFS transporter
MQWAAMAKEEKDHYELNKERQEQDETSDIHEQMLEVDKTMDAKPEPAGFGPNESGAGADSFRAEDGSLMDMYESRLRRLREYETRVYSRYASPAPNTNANQEVPAQNEVQDSQAPTLQVYHREGEPERSAAETQGLPDVIDVTEDEGEMPDDLTMSTGVNSNSAMDFPAPARNAVRPQEGIVEQRRDSEEEKLDEDYQESQQSSQQPWTNNTEYSTESSSEIPIKKPAGSTENAKQEDNTESNGEGYGYSAAPDSKYGRYSVLMNPDQDDRAVEIALYSAQRPHMRAFHLAWSAFFVAFFTWFAITPLLGEVASALELSREEIWTSSTLAVAGSAVTRVMIGPINDIYGARWTMFGTLVFSAIPTAIAGAAIQGAVSLYIIRLLIGVAGSAFVTCQFWTTTMFTAEVAGTANSLAAGWGNLGGGVAQLVMGSLLFPLLKVLYGGEGYGGAASYVESPPYDRASDLAWRTALLFPAVLCIVLAYMCIRYADDCPKGNFRKRKALGLMPIESTKDALRRGCSNWNTWLLFLQYGCCFGVEITMTNAAALYFQEEFGQNTESAAAIASVFGWMNLFARGIGGFLSDISGANYGMRGRLWCQVFTLLAEGALVCLFSTTDSLAAAIVVMAIFSIFVQAAEGSTFAIVPYVDYAVTGSISGVVGAGGNVGGVIFSLFFRSYENRQAILLMGAMALGCAFLTALVAIPGHRSLVSGSDAAEVLDRRDNHNEQVGSRPNVDLHLHNSDAVQSTLRTNPIDVTPDTHVDSIDNSVVSAERV